MWYRRKSKPSEIKRKKNIYCSIKCAGEGHQNRVKVPCDTCGATVTKVKSAVIPGRGNYCNKSCAATTNNKYKVRNWTDGSSSYSVRAKREYGEVCDKCGYDEHLEILEVHHVDCDRSNNDISNLRVLCPNCHKIEHYIKV